MLYRTGTECVQVCDRIVSKRAAVKNFFSAKPRKNFKEVFEKALYEVRIRLLKLKSGIADRLRLRSLAVLRLISIVCNYTINFVKQLFKSSLKILHSVG